MQIVENSPVAHYPRYQLALLRLAENEWDAYRKSCGAMLKLFANSNISVKLHFTVWTCSLAPNALVDYTPAIALAERSIELEPDNRQFLNCYGAILFRAGRYDAALTQLQAALTAGESSATSTAYTWYFLAMTHHQLGNTEQARNWFTKAADQTRAALTQGITISGDTMPWNRRLTLKLFHNEAARMLGMPAEAQKPAAAEVRDQKTEVRK